MKALLSEDYEGPNPVITNFYVFDKLKALEDSESSGRLTESECYALAELRKLDKYAKEHIFGWSSAFGDMYKVFLIREDCIALYARYEATKEANNEADYWLYDFVDWEKAADYKYAASVTIDGVVYRAEGVRYTRAEAEEAQKGSEDES